MARTLLLSMAPHLFLLLSCMALQSQGTRESLHSSILGEEKVTKLHFYLHDILSGDKPSAVLVAKPKKPGTGPTPFGTVFAIDDPLTEGPEAESRVVGNAQGLYVSSGQDQLGLVLYVDFGFTTGEFNGSSFSVFSRNPILSNERELAIVGGRGKFRLARGFAQLSTHSLNATNGDAIIEYNVTLLHYEHANL